MLLRDSLLKPFKLIAIDPGLNNTGIAIFLLKSDLNLTILEIEAFTLDVAKLTNLTELSVEDHKEQLVKRYVVKKLFSKILADVKPAVVVSESPFFNQKTASSFSILTEVISSLFDEAVLYDPSVSISTVSPLEVKKLLGVAGLKGKEVVLEAVSKVSELTSVLINDLNALDQHSIDGIAVGWRWINDRRKILRAQSEKTE